MVVSTCEYPWTRVCICRKYPINASSHVGVFSKTALPIAYSVCVYTGLASCSMNEREGGDRLGTAK